jgi:hypothetical protein
MAALARHPTAITPSHYVICRTAPSDPADHAAWPPPLATGTGRVENTKIKNSHYRPEFIIHAIPQGGANGR